MTKMGIHIRSAFIWSPNLRACSVESELYNNRHMEEESGQPRFAVGIEGRGCATTSETCLGHCSDRRCAFPLLSIAWDIVS